MGGTGGRMQNWARVNISSASIYQARQLMGNLCKIVSQTRQMSNIEPFDALTTFLVIANSSTIFRRGQLMQFVHPTTIFSQ